MFLKNSKKISKRGNESRRIREQGESTFENIDERDEDYLYNDNPKRMPISSEDNNVSGSVNIEKLKIKKKEKKEKKRSINNEYITENKKEYTQLYDSSVIPDFFNDFLVDFMENRNYFLLDKDELVKLIEYFCFWLFLEGYTDSHLTKVD